MTTWNMLTPIRNSLPGPKPWVSPDQNPHAVDRAAAAVLPILWVLAHGAALTSLGLALATWLSRPARAVTISVAYYVAVTIGSALFVEMVIAPALRDWANQRVVVPPGTPPAVASARWQEVNARVAWIEEGLLSVSPFGGQIAPAEALVRCYRVTYRKRFWAFQAALIAATFAFAAALLGLTVATFDRCLGRVSERAAVGAPGPGPRRPFSILRRFQIGGIRDSRKDLYRSTSG
jgi:hypothetical protein